MCCSVCYSVCRRVLYALVMCEERLLKATALAMYRGVLRVVQCALQCVLQHVLQCVLQCVSPCVVCPCNVEGRASQSYSAGRAGVCCSLLQCVL